MQQTTDLAEGWDAHVRLELTRHQVQVVRFQTQRGVVGDAVVELDGIVVPAHLVGVGAVDVVQVLGALEVAPTEGHRHAAVVRTVLDVVQLAGGAPLQGHVGAVLRQERLEVGALVDGQRQRRGRGVHGGEFEDAHELLELGQDGGQHGAVLLAVLHDFLFVVQEELLGLAANVEGDFLGGDAQVLRRLVESAHVDDQHHVVEVAVATERDLFEAHGLAQRGTHLVLAQHVREYEQVVEVAAVEAPEGQFGPGQQPHLLHDEVDELTDAFVAKEVGLHAMSHVLHTHQEGDLLPRGQAIGLDVPHVVERLLLVLVDAGAQVEGGGLGQFHDFGLQSIELRQDGVLSIDDDDELLRAVHVQVLTVHQATLPRQVVAHLGGEHQFEFAVHRHHLSLRRVRHQFVEQGMAVVVPVLREVVLDEEHHDAGEAGPVGVDTFGPQQVQVIEGEGTAQRGEHVEVDVLVFEVLVLGVVRVGAEGDDDEVDALRHPVLLRRHVVVHGVALRDELHQALAELSELRHLVALHRDVLLVIVDLVVHVLALDLCVDEGALARVPHDDHHLLVRGPQIQEGLLRLFRAGLRQGFQELL